MLGRIRRDTGRRSWGRQCGALGTELHACGILVLAPGKLHARASPRAWARNLRTGDPTV